MMRGWIGVSLAMIVASACNSKGPQFVNFTCGWGAVCPPASACDSCSGIDCSMPCYADTPCNSNGDCPTGTVCDAASRYCLPAKPCDAHGDCAATELCVIEAELPFSHGLCMEVDATPAASCESCSFPWFCQKGTCVLHCQKGDASFTLGSTSSVCPGTLNCVDQFCVP